jgi:transcriptional regulator with XRE-family HTH domain
MTRKKRETYIIDTETIMANTDGDSNKVKRSFALRFNEMLKDSEITQEELRDMTGLSDGSISNYRNGLTEPTITSLYRIAECLNVSADYLIGLSQMGPRNSDAQAAAKYIGLNERSLRFLHVFGESEGKLLEILDFMLAPGDDDSLAEVITLLRYFRDYYRSFCNHKFGGRTPIGREILKISQDDSWLAVLAQEYKVSQKANAMLERVKKQIVEMVEEEEERKWGKTDNETGGHDDDEQEED